MRITVSTKPLYDPNRVNTMLHFYELLLKSKECLVTGEIQEFGDVEKLVLRSCMNLKQAEKCGLKNTEYGEKLCEEVKSLLQQSFSDKYNKWKKTYELA